MRVVVLSITYRTFLNILPVIVDLQERGHTVDIVWIPTCLQFPGQDPAAAGFAPALSSPHADGQKPGEEFWREFETLIRRTSPDLVLSDDMTNWPCQVSYQRFRQARSHGVFVAFQHGLFQTWQAMDAEFNADYFLCFGSQHVYNFSQENWARVLPVGLPKLDRLASQATSKDGYILFMAQRSPQPDIATSMLEDFSEAMKLPVKVRPHPGHPDAFRQLSESFEILDPLVDPVEQMAACDVMVTTHSTAILEALLLDKDVVVVPSFGLTDFGLFPFVARDLTGPHLKMALNHIRKRSSEVERFLTVTCGGRRWNSTERTRRVLEELVSRHRDSPNKQPWWASDQGLVDVLADDHPLCTIRALLSQTPPRPTSTPEERDTSLAAKINRILRRT